MVGFYFEDWAARKQTLRECLGRSVNVGLPALKSGDAKTAMVEMSLVQTVEPSEMPEKNSKYPQ